MKFCSNCGGSISHRIPDDDDRHRHVCDECGMIHYENPKVIVGCLPVYEDRVLLCRRAIEPRSGLWTLPAGFMEIGETALDGAKRETWEEARAQVADEYLYTLFDLPHIDQMYLFYRVNVIDGKFAAGPESTDVQLFDEKNIPWDELAFPVVIDTLECFFKDRQQGQFPIRQLVIDRSRHQKS